ncbi:g-type lectin s-receptor-like serine/threonine-protein kinase at1g11330 [Phtheirospermum japonicum]|uniref:Receptor-like serine/threonine-protein kinase n=1 Tax=Phtheirospermum japonicum TaxID=374723 RepID=A0A830DCX2_9LAMI|nr:g-type lectin s-receptor-like serine/threonine-protein kinase at1g11330 [Phtheirospermum japonicum]
MKLFHKRSLFLILCFSFHGFCAETDTITSNLSIKDPGFLVSSGHVFKLGFFSPENTTNRYLAIYYVVSETTVIWVANRDNPLTDTSGTVTISIDGNLILNNGRNETIWSTNETKPSPMNLNSSAQILDTGNLVIRDIPTRNVIWDCFSHPANTFMPGMKLYENMSMSSWRSPSDPGVGDFTAAVRALNIPQAMTWKNGRPHWRSGPYNGIFFIGIKEMYLAYPGGGFRVGNDSGDIYFTSPALRFLTKTDLDLSGNLVQYLWDNRNKSWEVTWVSNQNEWFDPVSRDEWDRGNWTSGCTRRTQLQCDFENRNGDDTFLRMPFIKVPDFAQPFPARREDECRTFDGVGPDFHVRLAFSELENNDGRLVIIIPVLVGVAFVSICIFMAWCWMARRKGKRIKDQKALETLQSDSSAIVLKDESENINIEELPLFTFKTLADATNQFHDANMLGRGGFGHVYKGRLANGKQVAVKRLSATSGQGGEEFRNEAVVISKVQHRNLVKLLGCCVEREEKMLVYEYMPNKSLDVCLFEPTHPSQKILDWVKRFSIVEGIGRGLLYLHMDSRLKIIHRDLKPSNVLLDGNWNPKISDFGMARIFGGNQDQANTAKVVGTYGYMAPEYAVDGRFSEKSDVYSFGVLMLEIAWKLWNEGNGIAFADQTIANLSFEAEIVRCIHIALLCVQEFPKDRPAVQTVVSMLNHEIADLPLPEQPVFAEKWDRIHVESTRPTRQNGYSINELTITVLDGR